MATSLNTNEFPTYLDKMEVEIPVNINLWGFNTQLVDQLTDQLPQQIIQESYYPKTDRLFEWQINIDGRFYGLQNSIEFSFEVMNDSVVTQLSSDIEEVANTKTVNSPIDGSVQITGKSVNYQDLVSLFSSYAESGSYVIHLVNFDFLDDEGSTHWITLGDTHVIDNVGDMRSVIDLGNRQLFFDPTALAPYFYINDLAEDERILEGLTSIVEQVIAGSPQTFNLLAQESIIEVDRITISASGQDRVRDRFADTNVVIPFDHAVDDLMPYFDKGQLDSDIDLTELPQLEAAINLATEEIDGEQVVIVDKSLAEAFKREIRQNLHSEFPDGWYYSIVMMADAERKYMYRVHDTDGQSTGELKEYNVGEIGLALDGLSPFYSIPLTELTTQRSLYESLQLLGKNFGLSTLNSSYSMQIESPMSTYGVTDNWNDGFSQFDIDQLQRRHAMTFRSKITYELNALFDDFGDSFYFWLDTTELEELQELVNLGDHEVENLNYTGAMNYYLTVLEDLDEAAQPFNNSRNFVQYGSLLLVFVVLLAYYSKILAEDALSKEELKKRVKENRKFHKKAETENKV